VFNRTFAMKLIHAADIHLDSPMCGLAKYDGAPLGELRHATRRALANLVDLAIEEQVTGVLLAGDLFDGDWSHYGTGVHFIGEMARLRDAGIIVVTISGNHDAKSKLTKSLHLPENVYTLGTEKPETEVFEELGIAIHGQGYATPSVLEDISAGYPDPLGDLINIGLLHTCASGRPNHENYAPCKVETLRQRGYAYWGLGHVHTHEVLSTDPPIAFSGILQGRGIREAGPKGAVLLEVGEDGMVSFEHRVLDSVRWELIKLDAGDCAGLDEVCERARSDMRTAVDAAGERLLAARVVIYGESEAHRQLLADTERLRYEMVGAAADVACDRVWIEGVKVQTTPMQPAPTSGDDAMGELLRELVEIDANDAEVGQIAEELRSVSEILPPDVREVWDPTSPEAVREVLAELTVSLPVALHRRAGS
jgi:DNA repair protein SbcD/Mre11